MEEGGREWDDTPEALGGGEEAHRRWPEGRNEQGTSKAKVHPSSRLFEESCRVIDHRISTPYHYRGEMKIV